jgi:hypothetical protein
MLKPAQKLFQNIGDCLERKTPRDLTDNDEFTLFMAARTISMDSPKRAIMANEILGDLDNLTDQQAFDLVLTCFPKISVSGIFRSKKFLKKETPK